jgi:hypothetical protein
MDVSVRVAIAVFVICAPTLLFLGLWRGLTSLRDDDLAGEVSARQLRGVFEALPSGQPDAGRFEELPDGEVASTPVGRSYRSDSNPTAAPKAGESKGGNEVQDRPFEPASTSEVGVEVDVEADPLECPRCTEPNPTGAELCWECGAYLNTRLSGEPYVHE